MTTTSLGDPLVGALLDGRYSITGRLARGGMATVYTALDTRLTRTVAVKLMHVGLGDDVEFARKFDREARSAARLSHPHVVSVFDQGRDEGRPYIVMEYVEGHTLRDVLNREAPVPPLRALQLIEPVLSALGCAHEAGLVHRDVKPENVLISERGQVKVADFGLAKAVSSQTSTATQGLLIGTVSYLPPELVLSGKANARSDVYSAGVVLFELLTGRKPHTGDTPIQVAYAHVHKDVPAPSAFPTAGPIPPYLDALVARATARDASARPPDARVFLTQVRRVQAALRDGLLDDPELTQDLSPVRPSTTPSVTDRADVEVTELVSPPPFAPRTVRDVAPPGTSQPHLRQVSAERLRLQREREARRRRRGWLLLLLVLMLTTAVTVASWYVTVGRFTTAPALTRLPQDQAITAAAQADLSVATSSAYSEHVPKGTVISSEPPAGSKLRAGSTVSVLVSKGPERHPMPRLVGLTRPAAQAALTAEQLRVGRITAAWHETILSGRVVSAGKDAGQQLKPGTPIDLVISKGPRPIPIPRVVEDKAARAEAALVRAGFRVGKTTVHSGTVAAGRVIRQVPATGTGHRGDQIKLTISRGPVLVSVPNVRSMGVKAASAVMRRAGFQVQVKPVAVNYIGVGFVVTSAPAAGKQAPKGSTVTLYVV